MVYAQSGHEHLKLRIGLTGGIGAGKSAVSALFADHGVPVIDADLVAREVVEPGTPALAAIVALFGPDIVDQNGCLRRAELKRRIFDDAALRQRLEQILHPRIRTCMDHAARTTAAPYCILVIPLLLEANQRDLVDRILVVDCPAEVQRQRVMQRDQLTAADVDAIMHTQASREARLQAADDVIRNDSDGNHLVKQVEALHQQYLALTGGAAH